MNLFYRDILLYITPLCFAEPVKEGVGVTAELLVKRAGQGDKDALVQLIMVQKQDYYKLAYIYMKNKDDALDAMADMIAIVYEKIHQLKKTEAFYSWSKTILVNCCKKRLKERCKVVPLETIEAQVCKDELRAKEEQIALEGYLSKLNEKHREVLKLRYFLDMDYGTISELLKIKPGTVKSRISIGLRNLKEILGGDGI